jgi:hypothetical protein
MKKPEPFFQSSVTHYTASFDGRPLEVTMMTRLTLIAYFGLVFTGCDSSPLNPVQQSTGGTSGVGGSTQVIPQSGLGGGTNVGGATGAGGTTGVGGTTGTTPVEPTEGSCLIVPSETGWVDGTNACKIQGAWFAYNDCDTSPTDCTTDQVPTVRSADGFPNTDGKMCTSGTTADIHGDYETIWGAGIGLNLNQVADSDNKGGIGALPHALKGFSFTISGTAFPAELRVNFPTATTEKTAHFYPITKGAGSYKVLFTDANQGDWVKGDARVDLVTADINSIQFQIVAKDGGTVPFDLCVENLTALY